MHAVARFQQGSEEDKNNIHWARWERMSYAKSKGGTRFRDFPRFNQALIAKQGQRSLQFPKWLVAKILEARYFKHTDFLNASTGSNSSYIQRSILWGKQVIQQGARRWIGNEGKIQVYKDSWIPRLDSFKPISVSTIPEDVVVADLIDSENQWNVDLVEQHFAKEDADAISKIPLLMSQKQNEMCQYCNKKIGN